MSEHDDETMPTRSNGSLEERINLVRGWLADVSVETSDFQSNSCGGSPKLQETVNKIDDIIGEFERIVDDLMARAEGGGR